MMIGIEETLVEAASTGKRRHEPAQKSCWVLPPPDALSASPTIRRSRGPDLPWLLLDLLKDGDGLACA